MGFSSYYVTFQRGHFSFASSFRSITCDITGMVELMGGTEAVRNDLEHFFNSTPEHLYWNDFYNHSNEPVHHVPFLFNRIGSPWLTQKWTRHICRNAYHDAVDGLVGNDDVGQMSAWYVLASIGLHPVCPGDTHFEITSRFLTKLPFICRNIKHSRYMHIRIVPTTFISGLLPSMEKNRTGAMSTISILWKEVH